MSVWRFWLTHRSELRVLIEQHVLLVFVSTLAAIVIGIPAGIAAARRPRTGRAILAVANAAQTIPSLALLGFLLPLPFVGGIGPRTALIALAIYALLPIVRTTVTGISTVDPAIVEAGVAMGMTERQLLWLVQLPLALPSIVAGIRVATVIGVGTATIAAAIGAGGLGEYIFRGLAMVDTTTILAGAIPAATLALAADGALAWIERLMQRGRLSAAGAARLLAAAVVLVMAVIAALYATSRRETIVVGSKNFTEQVILGELVAQAIESEGGVEVVRKLNLGGTFVCDRGIRAGELDVYVEYTGTAVSAVFHQPVPRDPRRAFERARDLYASSGVTVLDPLGFNNTFAILVRSTDAQARGLRTIDDLRSAARGWTPGFGYEFLQRDDGYPGLVRTYGLHFGSQPRAMDLSLIYRALADRQVDVIAGDATSAMIDALQLTPLEDNRHYFPPYDAVPLVRTASLLRHPAITRALKRLAGHVSDRDMRAMNAAVDLQHRDVREVVAEFLQHLDRHLVDGIVPVPEAVPLGALGLTTAREVGATDPQRAAAGFRDARDELPPLPALAIAGADEARLLPCVAADAHLDARNRGRPGPRHATDCHFSRPDLRVWRWLSDESADLLQRHRLADDAPFTLPLVPVLVVLVMSGERLVDQLDVGQPFD